MPEKLCYILIDFDMDTYRHYLYLYELIERVAASTEVFLIIERVSGEPSRFQNVKEVYICRKKGFISRKWDLFRGLWRARRKGYKVVYAHYSYMGAILGGFLSRIFGGRCYFWNCLEVPQLLQDIREMSGGGWQVEVRNWLFWQRMRLTLALIQRLVTGSEVMAQRYMRDFGIRREKILVLPNWVNVPRLQEGAQHSRARETLNIPPDHQIVLFLHGLHRGKGAHFLPRIIKETVAQRPHTTFIIIGDGPLRGPIETEMHERGVWEQVRMLGHVPNQAVGAYFGVADLFILPSWFEAFTRVLLEAMATGVPFVATDGGGGIPAYTSAMQQEFVVPVDEIGRFPELIISLLDDPEKRKALKEEGFRQVQAYSEDRAVERFLSLVVGGNGNK